MKLFHFEYEIFEFENEIVQWLQVSIVIVES